MVQRGGPRGMNSGSGAAPYFFLLWPCRFYVNRVAYVSVYFIPGFTLALGFLLGGIISPPDAVAATL